MFQHNAIMTCLLLALASGSVVAAEPQVPTTENQPVALLDTPLPGSDHAALTLSLDTSIRSPLAGTDSSLNSVNVDLSYSWGADSHFLRLFSGYSYQINNDSSLINIRDLEDHHRTMFGLDWQTGSFIGSFYTEAILPATTQGWSDPALNPSYNMEMGWDTGNYGKISIGARNLLDKPQPQNQLESALDMPEALGRVPYIRYQIDL